MEITSTLIMDWIFYAPQTNVDAAGRRVMIAWLRMPKAVEQEGKEPWNGMMCLPRVVELENGHIYFRVHPEVDTFLKRKYCQKRKFLTEKKIFRRFLFMKESHTVSG